MWTGVCHYSCVPCFFQTYDCLGDLTKLRCLRLECGRSHDGLGRALKGMHRYTILLNVHRPTTPVRFHVIVAGSFDVIISCPRCNSSSVWWHQTNKNHHQASLWQILSWTNSQSSKDEKNIHVNTTRRERKFQKMSRNRGLVVNFENVT